MSIPIEARLRRSLTRGVAICTIVAVLASIVFTSVGSANSSGNDAQSSRIYFMMDKTFLGMSLSFAADLSWNGVLNLNQGETGSIRYAFSPGPADLSVFLPLGDYLWLFGIEDVRLNIPLGDTPLEEYTLSLTGLLGIPEWLASVDLVVEPSLRLSDVVCSNVLGHVGVDASTMTWYDWSDKSVTYFSDEVGEAIVSASFSYTFSLGIKLTMLADLLEHDLVPEITLLTLRGSQVAVTSIDVHMQIPSWFDRNGVAALSFIVEGFAIYVVLVAASRTFRN